MSCDTCQDCGCDNITLPIGPAGATGATGATGPQGPAGAAGTPGVPGTGGFIVLHNDTTQSTTASATTALFTASKSYTVPQNTLSMNGSKLIVTALFSTTGANVTGDSTASIFIGGASFTAKTSPFFIQHSNSDGEQYLKVRLEISRDSATNLFINCDTYIAVSEGQTVDSFHFLENTLTVSDLATNSLTIDCRGKTNGSITTFNCDQLTVDHLIA
jgi:hypothetical protein